MTREQVVRILAVRFTRSEGPMTGYQVTDDETGEPMGLGLFSTRELARAAANVRGWTVVVESPVVVP